MPTERHSIPSLYSVQVPSIHEGVFTEPEGGRLREFCGPNQSNSARKTQLFLALGPGIARFRRVCGGGDRSRFSLISFIRPGQIQRHH